MHGIYYDGRGLNKSLLNDLFRCQYIGCHQSIVLQGPTGSGKIYLACALAKQACLGQIKPRYIRLPDLLMEYGDASVVQGKQKRLLASYSKIPLLVIDEWLVSDISDNELYFLFELFERQPTRFSFLSRPVRTAAAAAGTASVAATMSAESSLSEFALIRL